MGHGPVDDLEGLRHKTEAICGGVEERVQVKGDPIWGHSKSGPTSFNHFKVAVNACAASSTALRTLNTTPPTGECISPETDAIALSTPLSEPIFEKPSTSELRAKSGVGNMFFFSDPHIGPRQRRTSSEVVSAFGDMWKPRKRLMERTDSRRDVGTSRRTPVMMVAIADGGLREQKCKYRDRTSGRITDKSSLGSPNIANAALAYPAGGTGLRSTSLVHRQILAQAQYYDSRSDGIPGGVYPLSRHKHVAIELSCPRIFLSDTTLWKETEASAGSYVQLYPATTIAGRLPLYNDPTGPDGHNAESRGKRLHYLVSWYGQRLPGVNISAPIRIYPFEDVWKTASSFSSQIPCQMFYRTAMHDQRGYRCGRPMGMTTDRGRMIPAGTGACPLLWNSQLSYMHKRDTNTLLGHASTTPFDRVGRSLNGPVENTFFDSETFQALVNSRTIRVPPKLAYVGRWMDPNLTKHPFSHLEAFIEDQEAGGECRTRRDIHI
ncbi:hypothetical protein BJ322DRAFT_1021325 [Thelephora terrestris]|uniref:Uncharacterized protein n=1 Tax=Thelephora terrestris TaxID=56493 RepID=A0A9P6HD35_9AGAM|nr:hypothetical protein BJ322DRAFT_1021325 [Thelephora terrestris]